MTPTIRRILVPVDFSPNSDLAVRHATALAAGLGGAVEVLHVVEDPIVTGAWNSEVVIPNLPGLLDELTKEAERRIEAYRSSSQEPHVQMTTAVRTGQPAHTIIAHAEERKADLIVMGTHGRSGLAHMFMGSVAERVVRHAPCPVLTVRANTKGAGGTPPDAVA